LALGFFKKKKDEPEGVPGDDASATSDGADSGLEPGAIRPEPDKARRFFDRAQTVHDTGNYEYAMTLWLQGLRMDPTSLAGLESFMKSGGEFLSTTKKSKGPTKDQIAAVSAKSPVEKYLRALLEWGARPLEWQYALKAMEVAARMGLNEAAYWIGERALGLAGQDPKAKKDSFVQMLNLFEKIGGIDRAVVAGDLACRLDPTDGPLIGRVRNLSAQAAMNKGGYEKTGQAGGFRENVRNLDAQKERDEEERLVKSEDVQERNIERAKADYASRPTDDAAITKLARFLLERARPEDEKLAFQILSKGFETNQNYRFKMQAGDIKLRVGRRKLRALKTELEKDPTDTARQEQYNRAARQLLDEEIKEFEERVAAYPTDLNLRLELGRRHLEAGDYEKAIEHFQHARGSPQMLNKALMGLAQAFERLGWIDEAESTYREAVERHENPNDELGAELRYGLMSTLERKARENRDFSAAEEAFKLASSIAMQRIGFRDIRDRRTALQELVKTLRDGNR
jgi:tetratricopeptide (TPR) repeat protein